MKIIVTGSLAFDWIMDFPGKFSDHILPEKIHQINLSFLVNKLTKQRGGTAGNIAYNLALLGEKPIILATAGYDFDEYQKELNKVGVNTLMIHIIRVEPTASAFIFTDKSDNQITGFYPGAMKEAGKCSIVDVIPSVVEGSRPQPHASLDSSARPSGLVGMTTKPFVVISPNDPLAMMNFVKECHQLNLDYMFDPGMQLPRLSDQDLRLGIEGAKIVIGNDYEMSLIEKRLKLFRHSGDDSKQSVEEDSRIKDGFWTSQNDEKSQIWITTLGEKGAEISSYPPDSSNPSIVLIPPAKPVKVVDPTGAGDAWRAGFLAGILTGQPLDVCGRMGSVASVYTVEKYGTQTHKFTKKEFWKRYEENYNVKRTDSNQRGA